MKIDDILLKYVNRDRGKSRTIGRYWATDIGAIQKGYLVPKNFFGKSNADLTGARMMITGIAMEDQLDRIFQETGVIYKSQTKKTIKISDEITLVAKLDFEFKDFIIETKFPFSFIKTNEIPMRYLYQLECQYRVFKKKILLGILSTPFNCKLLPYTPSEQRWNDICNILEKFHQGLKTITKEA